MNYKQKRTMYINHNKIFKLSLAPWQVLLLSAARENKGNLKDVIINYIEDEEAYRKMLEDGLLKLVKGNSKDTEFSKIRLGVKGKKILEDLEEAEVDEASIKLRDWMVLEFEKRDKKPGNKKRLAEGLAQFASETRIEKNHLATLILAYLEDDDNMEYNHIAEKVLFSSKNIYSRKFNINECRLYSYYQKRQKDFDEKFKTITNGKS